MNMPADQAIRRIAHYESMLQRAEEIISSNAIQQTGEMQELLRALEAYYTSDEWKQDFESDQAGLLPADLKRGVLSEDGIDHMLDDGREWLSSVSEKEER